MITKVLGAQRSDILVAAVLQFLLLSAFAALLAVPVGVATAWAISAILLNVAFALDWGGIGLVAIGVVAVTAVLGATTLLRVLARRPALQLREMASI